MLNEECGVVPLLGDCIGGWWISVEICNALYSTQDFLTKHTVEER